MLNKVIIFLIFFIGLKRKEHYLQRGDPPRFSELRKRIEGKSYSDTGAEINRAWRVNRIYIEAWSNTKHNNFIILFFFIDLKKGTLRTRRTQLIFY